MDDDVGELPNSGRVGMASGARWSPDAPCGILWFVERRGPGRDLVGLLVAWTAITLASFALSRVFPPGWWTGG